MSQLGVGVMLRMLGGNEESAGAMQAAIGKTIATVALEGDSVLAFTFDDGTRLRLTDTGQSCCESRYMRTDDDLSGFVGATLLGAEVRPAPSIATEYGDHDVEFLVIETSKGAFTMSNHNEHNGYYGGLSIEASS